MHKNIETYVLLENRGVYILSVIHVENEYCQGVIIRIR